MLIRMNRSNFGNLYIVNATMSQALLNPILVLRGIRFPPQAILGMDNWCNNKNIHPRKLSGFLSLNFKIRSRDVGPGLAGAESVGCNGGTQAADGSRKLSQDEFGIFDNFIVKRLDLGVKRSYNNIG